MQNAQETRHMSKAVDLKSKGCLEELDHKEMFLSRTGIELRFSTRTNKAIEASLTVCTPLV
jgi:hypothetical protein